MSKVRPPRSPPSTRSRATVDGLHHRRRHRVPRPHRRPDLDAAPPAAHPGRRLQGLQEHARSSRHRRHRRGVAGRVLGRPDGHRLRRRRRLGRRQGPARLRPRVPKLIVKGGVVDGKPLSMKDLSALADLPSRDVLLAQIAGLLASPLRTMAGLLKAVPQNFAYGLSALIESKGGVAPAEVEVEGSPRLRPGSRKLLRQRATTTRHPSRRSQSRRRPPRPSPRLKFPSKRPPRPNPKRNRSGRRGPRGRARR